MGARVIDFDAAGDGKIHIAGADRPRRIADRVEPGGAEPVDGQPGDGVGQSGQQQRHARHVAVVFACLIGATEEDFIELRPVGLRMARDERPDRNRGEIVGANLRECAAVPADRGARRITNENLAHGSLPRRAVVPTARRAFRYCYLGGADDRVKSAPFGWNDRALTRSGRNVTRMRI